MNRSNDLAPYLLKRRVTSEVARRLSLDHSLGEITKRTVVMDLPSIPVMPWPRAGLWQKYKAEIFMQADLFSHLNLIMGALCNMSG